jgi:hypothetical protein
MPDEKFELVLGIRDDRRTDPVQTAKVALSRQQVLHVYDLRKNSFTVAVHTSPHEVHQAEDQLPIVVLEAPEEVAVLYGRYNWSQKSLTHGNYMFPCFKVKVRRDASSNVVYDADHEVDYVSYTQTLRE